MNVTFAKAAAAYLRPAAPSATPATPGTGGEFSNLVRDAAQGAIGSLKAGEAASVQAIAGKADINQVVMAVANAEVTLQTAVAVRDKVIQAYLDIVRMPI